MLKKDITYENFDGDEVTETFYFNISRGELARYEIENESADGGLEKKLKEIVAQRDGKKIMEMFEEIILLAYGERSQDGKLFHKSPDVAERFKQHPAFGELLYELCTQATAGAEFVINVLPKAIREKMPQTIELPGLGSHPLQNVTDHTTTGDGKEEPTKTSDIFPNRPPLGEVKTAEMSKTEMAEELLGANIAQITALLNNPAKVGEAVELIDAMSPEQFRKLMGKFGGHTMPKVLLNRALQRF